MTPFGKAYTNFCEVQGQTSRSQSSAMATGWGGRLADAASVPAERSRHIRETRTTRKRQLHESHPGSKL